ncbi:ATP-binding protein [Selenomonas sp. KH1T6]|uniref:ATP-binding protein n=1 Tax=Selenomonas sp. KH1T6 TaxID=3158784 RepID=UPI0008A745E2|nr:PD-(D/E)XK nuclease superfamily protein [Selenomonas ruminantium]
MAEEIRKLPIGVQSFEVMRQEQFLYVDKTRYIYELAHTGRQYFLSRPRRFGKSLFLSTLKAYWQGRKELFEGLEIVELEKDSEGAFEPYPVFYFDFNGQNYQAAALEDVLDKMLGRWEEQYDCKGQGTLSGRFEDLLLAAREKTGKKCVVLVDEYDKPLLEVLENNELEEHNKAVFKGFFGTLKSYDEYLRFVFITGVTKFSKVSIFSDLNQLNDISLSAEYAGICGITEVEMEENFALEIEGMAGKLGIAREECLVELRKMYDGYRFHPDATGVYNPFSLLKAFWGKELGYYWFGTGTPTFLVRRMRDMHFDVRQLETGAIHATVGALSDYRAENPDIVPLLYQTGYLTLFGYDARRRRYTLGFPNEEVKYGFLESLLPVYTPAAVPGRGTDFFALDDSLEAGDAERVGEILTALFASIPYTTDDAPFEHYFQSVLYIVFTLLGQHTHCEVHSSRGRADCILETDRFVYIFEFKVDKSAKEALAQIEEKGYAAPYGADKRQLFKIGVNFDSESRSLSEWLVG